MTLLIILIVAAISSTWQFGSSHALKEAVCSEIVPELLIVDGERQLVLSDMCGKALILQYPTQIHNIYLCSINAAEDHRELCSSIELEETENASLRKGLLSNESTLVKYEVIEGLTLRITSSRYSMCISKITVKNCKNNSTNRTSYRERSKRFIKQRSSAPFDQDTSNYNSLFKPVIVLVSSFGFLIILTTMIIVSLSCCDDGKVRSKKNSQIQNDPEAAVEMDPCYNTKSTEINKPVVCFDGSWTPPSSPTISATTNASSDAPEYLRPSSLNIPALVEQEQAANRLNHSRTETNKMTSNARIDKDHLYSVLDIDRPSSIHSGTFQSPKFQRYSTTTTTTTTTTSEGDKGYLEKKPSDRAYFVLDISADGPSIKSEKSIDSTEPLMVIQDDQYSHTLPHETSERIYHVLEPLSSEEQHCAVCNTKIQDEPDSIYLLILPDYPTPQQEATPLPLGTTPSASTDQEPIYQVLEKPSAICQCCLYANENDPIYHEVERLPDPIYERIKMFRQDTSLSDSSHLYMSLEIPDAETPVSPRKKYLREIRMASSHDYASIPGSPMGSPIRRVSIEEQPQLSQLSQLVNTLKKKLVNQLKNTYHQDVVSDNFNASPEEDENNLDDCHHTYANTGPSVDAMVTLSQVQIKLDGMKEHKDSSLYPIVEKNSPTKSGIVRSRSHNYTPLIIAAQQQGSESYHPLNIDNTSISVIMRHGKPVKKVGKRVTSLRTRLSIFREKSKQSSTDPNEYEIPINLHPFVMPENLAIPPPLVIRTSQVNLFRQDALLDKDEKRQNSNDSGHNNVTNMHGTPVATPARKGYKLSTISALSISEPCLSNSSDDYDYLEKLPSPTKGATLPHPTSPTKAILGRAQTAPVLRPALLYGNNDSDDYDFLLPPDEMAV